MLKAKDSKKFHEEYKILACLFNSFFCNEKPAVKLKKLRNLLAYKPFVEFTDDANHNRIWHYHDELVEFKNKWYKPPGEVFDCPFEYFKTFLDNPREHLKGLFEFANDLETKWLEDSINSSVTKKDIDDLKDEVRTNIGAVSKEDLATENYFDVADWE